MSGRFDHVTSRRAGQRRFVDLHMHMPADWTLGRAAEERGRVERALMQALPGLSRQHPVAAFGHGSPSRRRDRQRVITLVQR